MQILGCYTSYSLHLKHPIQTNIFTHPGSQLHVAAQSRRQLALRFNGHCNFAFIQRLSCSSSYSNRRPARSRPFKAGKKSGDTLVFELKKLRVGRGVGDVLEAQALDDRGLTTLLTKMSKERISHRALDVFRWAQEHTEIEFNEFHYSACIRALGEIGSFPLLRFVCA
eukprot:9469108-Pyramimonas_sp.AAC.1